MKFLVSLRALLNSELEHIRTLNTQSIQKMLKIKSLHPEDKGLWLLHKRQLLTVVSQVY